LSSAATDVDGSTARLDDDNTLLVDDDDVDINDDITTQFTLTPPYPPYLVNKSLSAAICAWGGGGELVNTYIDSDNDVS
jgi:hypothetical protein